MIRNILILIYVVAVLFVSANVQAAITLNKLDIDTHSNLVFVQGSHTFSGNLEIVPRIIKFEDNRVTIEMEPTCGRSCRPSQEKQFASLFDINELNLPAGQVFNIYIREANSERFLGTVRTGENNVTPEREQHEGFLFREGDRVFLRENGENIYLSIPQQVNIDQYLNKNVEISGFRNVFYESDANFYVLSIAENNIL